MFMPISYHGNCPLLSCDCALRSDWEDELRAEKEMLERDVVTELHALMKLLAHPLRLKIILMLLKRDPLCLRVLLCI